MIAPTVSLHGTNPEQLLALRSDARHALSLAIQALKDMAPSGRDYDSGVVFIEACKMHDQRYYALEAIRMELEAEMDAIMKANE